MKVKRVVLKQYNADAMEWVAVHPRVDANMIIGEVASATTLGGHPVDYFMTAKFDDGPMHVQNNAGDHVGVVAGRMTISQRDVDIDKTGDQELFVAGNAYVRNGLRVATVSELDERSAALEVLFKDTKVNNAIEADRLVRPVKINGVTFDGTADVQIKTYEVSALAPTDTSKLWVNPTDRVLRFYDGGAWQPIVGTWA